MRLVTVTPNPALDRTLLLTELAAGEVHRETGLYLHAAGKGINTGRAAKTLGADVLCVAPGGGMTGTRMRQLAKAEGLPVVWTAMEVETRTCTVLVEEQTGRTTVINERGSRMHDAEWQALCDAALSEATGATVCVSGSVLPGVTPGAYSALLHRLVESANEVWVDASGDLLKAACGVKGVRVKVNVAELEAVIGRVGTSLDEAARALRVCRDANVPVHVVTVGHEGAVMRADRDVVSAAAPALHRACPLGSGDAFLAGLLVARQRELTDADCLRCALAAGTANAMQIGAGVFRVEQYEALLTKLR